MYAMQTQITIKQILARQAIAVSQDHRKALRVAARWLKARLDDELDIMWRLQVLEGAARVPFGKWWHNGEQGLAQAERFLKAEQAKVNPKWLSSSPSGLYRDVKATVEEAISKLEPPGIEVDDVLQATLLGEGLASGQELGTKLLYSLGARLSRTIMSGQTGPAAVEWMLGKNLWHKVQNYTSGKQREVLTPNKRMPSPKSDPVDPGEALGDLLVQDRTNRVSQQMFRMMHEVWKDIPVMQYWLKAVETGQEAPNKKEMGEFLAGRPLERVEAQNWSHKVSVIWNRAWLRFIDALWRDQPLLDGIQQYMTHQGLDWELRKPSEQELDNLFPPRRR